MLSPTNLRTYFATLERLDIIQKLKEKEKKAFIARLKAHRKVLHLNHAPKGIQNITYYQLTYPAKDFFGSFDEWQWKLTKKDKKNIVSYKKKLSKSHAQIEKEQKQVKAKLRETANLFIKRRADGRTPQQQKSWLTGRADSLGVKVEDILHEVKKIDKEQKRKDEKK